MEMDDVWKVVGIICRYILAALACWWLFWFLALIGQSEERSQELAGMAIAKAIVCGAGAALWFYRAKRAKDAQKLVDYSVKTRQSVAPVHPDVVVPPVSTEQPQVIPPLDSQQTVTEQSEQQEKPMPVGGWVLIGVVCALFIVVLIIVISKSNMTSGSKPTNLFDAAPQAAQNSTVNSCPTGLPASVEIVPIADLSTLIASNGQVSHQHEENKEAWSFSFKVENQTASNRSERQFDGFCVTDLELVLHIRSEDGVVWDITGRQSLNAPYTYLSPGWSQEFKEMSLGTYRDPHNGSLSSWRITKAWGFPLNPVSSQKK